MPYALLMTATRYGCPTPRGARGSAFKARFQRPSPHGDQKPALKACFRRRFPRSGRQPALKARFQRRPPAMLMNLRSKHTNESTLRCQRCARAEHGNKVQAFREGLATSFVDVQIESLLQIIPLDTEMARYEPRRSETSGMQTPLGTPILSRCNHIGQGTIPVSLALGTEFKAAGWYVLNNEERVPLNATPSEAGTYDLKLEGIGPCSGSVLIQVCFIT